MEGHDDHAPGSVGDNYVAYVRDHFGYHYDAQEWMTREERAFLLELETRHTTEELEHYLAQTRSLDALQLVHLLHRYMKLSSELAPGPALDLIEECLSRSAYHGAVDYEELAEQGILMALTREENERASRLFARCEQLPDHAWKRASFFRGVISWHSGGEAAAREAWLRHVDEMGGEGARRDVESIYEIVAWLVEEGARHESPRTPALIEEFTALLKEEAVAQGARDVLVDLELLRQA